MAGFKTFINTVLTNTLKKLPTNDPQNTRMDSLVYYLRAEYVSTVGTYEPEPGPDMERALRELDVYVRKYRNTHDATDGEHQQQSSKKQKHSNKPPSPPPTLTIEDVDPYR